MFHYQARSPRLMNFPQHPSQYRYLWGLSLQYPETFSDHSHKCYSERFDPSPHLTAIDMNLVISFPSLDLSLKSLRVQGSKECPD